MSDIEKILATTPATPEIPKLSDEAIIELKTQLLQDVHLHENVAVAWASEARHDTLEEALYRGASCAVIIHELITKPGSEWLPGYIPPEELAPMVALQSALLKRRRLTNEVVDYGPGMLPGAWGLWEHGEQPNPLLSEIDISLLEANGYGIILDKHGRYADEIDTNA